MSGLRKPRARRCAQGAVRARIPGRGRWRPDRRAAGVARSAADAAAGVCAVRDRAGARPHAVARRRRGAVAPAVETLEVAGATRAARRRDLEVQGGAGRARVEGTVAGPRTHEGEHVLLDGAVVRHVLDGLRPAVRAWTRRIDLRARDGPRRRAGALRNPGVGADVHPGRGCDRTDAPGPLDARRG